MQIPAEIFKAYDIRGAVPRTLDEHIATALGRAFGARVRALGERRVAVGRDGRLSSPALTAALARALADAGLEVIDLGLCTTPMLYFACSTLCKSGVQVTGSHNPPADNGFKLVLGARAIFGEEIQQLRRAIEQEDWRAEAGGSIHQYDIFPEYLACIKGGIQLARPMRVALDCGNGAGAASAPAVLRAIGCEVQELFCEVDGSFPNHHPDPSRPENLRDLQRALQEGAAEIGLALDGDGDRLGVVTKDGQSIAADRQLMLFARDVLAREPGGTVVYDVKCSQQLAQAIREAGGQPLMHKTGHSLVKAKMAQVGAPLGGEMSGHIFFKERWYGFDDGTYAACRLLEILSREQDASALLRALPASCATPEINLRCAEGEPHRLAAELQKAASGAFAAPASVCTIDGLRVDWPDGFGLIRASNTTPQLVLRFEGHTPQALARIRAAMLALLEQVRPGAAAQCA